eukprot:12417682-Ditylum_brightwellii.AAC.1
MSTYGTLTNHPDQKLSKQVFKNNQGEWETKKFQYTKPFTNHFNYQHAVNDHNNLHHANPSLEVTCTTHHWPFRIFAEHLPMLSSSMSCCKRKKLGRTEEEETARGHTQYALSPTMHIDSRMENGKNWQRQSINNTPVVTLD